MPSDRATPSELAAAVESDRHEARPGFGREQGSEDGVKIHFLGAVGTVTGSRLLIEERGTKVLVDCGLYQGLKQLRNRNRAPFPTSIKDLDGVVMTHAHIDHSGYLPRLVADGYKGEIHVSPATRRLLHILLPDSGYLQEEWAKYANRKGFSKHKPAEPLYTKADAERVMPHLRSKAWHETFRIGNLEFRLQRAGHILGAASVKVTGDRRTLLISGDLGRPDDPLIPPPETPGRPDWIVMESTYGGRRHAERDLEAALAEVAGRTFERGGVLLVPAFAVGRAQLILYLLEKLMSEKRLKRAPIFVNSPMATNVTELYQQFTDDHRLTREACHRLCAGAHFVNSVEESRELNTRKGPAVIISASGMLTGGRVLHHFQALAPDDKNTVLLAGYQAAGTRGDRLLRGDREIKMFGVMVPVRAEIVNIDGFSAHADHDELISWLDRAEKPPRGVSLVHGEERAVDDLRCGIEETLRWRVHIPEYRETLDIG